MNSGDGHAFKIIQILPDVQHYRAPTCENCQWGSNHIMLNNINNILYLGHRQVMVRWLAYKVGCEGGGGGGGRGKLPIKQMSAQ